jgi:hypothetical protein
MALVGGETQMGVKGQATMKYFDLRQEPIYNRHKGEEMMNSTVTPQVTPSKADVPAPKKADLWSAKGLPTPKKFDLSLLKADLSALSPHLQEVVKDIMALKAIEASEHFLTHKSQRELLQHLNAQDLATVARILAGIK